MVLKPRARSSFQSEGFSLLEVLISSLLLVLVSLGVLPLLFRSVANNQRGAESTSVGAFAASELDMYLQIPFDEGPLVVPDTVQVLESAQHLPLPSSDGQVYLEAPNTAWVDGTATSLEGIRWSKATRVRQYGLSDLEPAAADGISALDNPLMGSTSPDFVHLKEIEVEIVGGREAGALGAGQHHTIRVLKAY